jgi:hypothetical protein
VTAALGQPVGDADAVNGFAEYGVAIEIQTFGCLDDHVNTPVRQGF